MKTTRQYPTQTILYLANILLLTALAARAAQGESIRVAVIQTEIEDTLDANLEKHLRFVGEATDANCRLGVFPENSLYWPEMSPQAPSKVELDEAIEAIRSAAKENHVYIAFGTAYRKTDTARFRNRAIVFGPRGEDVMAYWKGSEVPPSFRIDGVPCNLLICSDRWYLEMSEMPCLIDETKIIIDISGGHGGDDGRPDLRLIRYRPWAVRTGAWVIVSNPVHENTDFMGNSPWGGGSAVIRPDGSVMRHRQYDKDVMIIAEIDPELADRGAATRRRNHPLFRSFWDTGGELLHGGEIETTPDVKTLQSVATDLRIAVARMACSDNLSTNTQRVLRHIRQAAEGNADVVVFPELALTGARSEGVQAVDQATLDNALQKLRDEAKASAIQVIVGTPWTANARRHNCAVVIGDDGQVETRYSQIVVDRDSLFYGGTSLQDMWFDVKGIPAIVTIGDDADWIEIGDLAACRGMSLHFHLTNDADGASNTAVLRKQRNLLALSYAQVGAVANVAGPGGGGESMIVSRVGGHNQPAPADLEYYLPYQTSVIASGKTGESLLFATRQVAAKNPLDWDTHGRNRSRRYRKQGWDEWIKQGMRLVRPEESATDGD